MSKFNRTTKKRKKMVTLTYCSLFIGFCVLILCIVFI